MITPRCRLIILLGMLLPFTSPGQVNTQNPYQLPLIESLAVYQAQCAADSSNTLVDLQQFIPGIILDIRYATDENFTGEVIYPSAQAFARLPVAVALKQVQEDLNRRGLGLKIFDAYRPYSATLRFWDLIRDTLYVAAPWKGSRHNRGCAVDVTLVDLESQLDLEMPTPYDDFSEQAAATFTVLPTAAMENRNSLIEVMKRFGFDVMPSEWWHFDYQGWEKFDLMDISFEQLSER